jgi:hypothetical protein
MTFPGSFVIAVIAVTLLSLPIVIRLVIAATHGREIGARSLAKQPDTIELLEANAAAWNRLAEIQALEQPLLARCFACASSLGWSCSYSSMSHTPCSRAFMNTPPRASGPSWSYAPPTAASTS